MGVGARLHRASILDVARLRRASIQERMRPMLMKRTAALAALLVLPAGCTHGRSTKPIEQPYYSDSEPPFAPKRLWRLWVRWAPYPLDASKGIIFKEFQLIARDQAERRR